jgi:Fe-Mn family superoxide dismutase
MAFELPSLPYPEDALEPHIDARTMSIHHDKHHAAYTNNLNSALEGHADLAGKSIEALLGDLNAIPEAIRTVVRNNGGGYANHANHNLFWETMGPDAGGAPTGDLAAAIDDAFGSFTAFKEQFAKAATTRFGSGWAWLYVGRTASWLSARPPTRTRRSWRATPPSSVSTSGSTPTTSTTRTAGPTTSPPGGTSSTGTPWPSDTPRLKK